MIDEKQEGAAQAAIQRNNRFGTSGFLLANLIALEARVAVIEKLAQIEHAVPVAVVPAPVQPPTPPPAPVEEVLPVSPLLG